MSQSPKIGVFDSGVGGITVLSALRSRFPNASFVYYGDTAHVPYGTKTPGQIRQLCVDAATELLGKNLDCLVVACNTASSVALQEMQNVFGSIPVFGVVEPGVKVAINAYTSLPSSPAAPILLLATRATVRSHAYANALKNVGHPNVIEKECPLLVPMIEEGWIDHPILQLTIQEYVKDVLKQYSNGIALLGCTHYPWIKTQFEKFLPGWRVVDSASAVSEELELRFPHWNKEKYLNLKPPIEWIFSDPDALPLFIKNFIEKF